MHSDHQFGSDWTQQKLNCVGDYAKAWTKIMSAQKTRFGWKTRYIDAFSGTGTYLPRQKANSNGISPLLGELADSEQERQRLLKGSATLAILTEPKFDRIDLIEQKRAHAEQLRLLAGGALDQDVFVHQMDANEALKNLSHELTRTDRSLVFIDPYGCDVWWETLVALARTKVCDVWYLFPTMGVNRQLQSTVDDIPKYKQDALDRVLGTPDWRTAFYEESTERDLFGEELVQSRHAGPSRVESFFIDRLKTIFPAVHSECLQLRNSRNGHLFSLCFAVSNPSEQAQKLATKIAGHTIRKWSGK